MAPKAKKLKAMVKLQIPAGSANPAPPVGTALGPHGIPLMDFCKQFNEATKDRTGFVIPVIISIFENRTFTFITKMPPVSALVKKAAGLAKASGEPNKNKVGKITKKQVEEIAKQKMPDLNANDMEDAKLMVEGTARSMGIEVVE